MTATLDAGEVTQAPRYSTRRDPNTRTAGGRVAVLAAALGTPLMPWQRHVADVALEEHPTRPGRYRYPIVLVTVPRQAGKTTLLRAIAVERALSGGNRATFMTAQTGKDAGDRWKDLVGAVERSPLGTHTTAYRGAGAQSLILPNGSFVRAFAPTPKSIHGATAHLVMLDEIWAFDSVAGEDLWAAVQPTPITLPDKQLWMVSTAGTVRSSFMRSWVERGRAAIGDPNAEIAYFEWSMPDRFDTYDEAGWAFHPALGHTIALEDLRAAAASNSRGNFERSYLNRWTSSNETILDLDAWDDLGTDTEQLGAERVPVEGTAFGYDVASDRSTASIWAANRTDAGKVRLRVYRTAPGVTWLAGVLVGLHEHGGRLTADDGGPTRVVTDEVRRAGVPVDVLGGRDAATAWAAFKAAALDGLIEHDRSPALRQALEVAAERRHLDTPALSRSASAGPIDPLMAASAAHRLAVNTDDTIPIGF